MEVLVLNSLEFALALLKHQNEIFTFRTKKYWNDVYYVIRCYKHSHCKNLYIHAIDSNKKYRYVATIPYSKDKFIENENDTESCNATAIAHNEMKKLGVLLHVKNDEWYVNLKH